MTTNPAWDAADPPPEPVPVGSAEGADRLRAAMDDLDTDTREEAGQV